MTSLKFAVLHIDKFEQFIVTLRQLIQDRYTHTHTYLPLDETTMRSGLSKKLDNFSRSNLQSSMMIPLVYNSDGLLGITNALYKTETC